MHDNEIAISDQLVGRLIDEQFPEWASLSIMRLPPVGTDNQLFRLGDDLLVRMPRIDWAADAPAREMEWLPRIAPHLPARIPAPVALGEPCADYPFQWSVVPWLAGETITGTCLGDDSDNVDWPQLAVDLGDFLVALRGVDATGAPLKMGGARGSDLSEADNWVREWTAKAGNRVDGSEVIAAWEESLNAPRWDGTPVWLHCDIHEGNLLVRDRRLSAVIDWGGLGAGDPAAEVKAAWGFLPPEVVPAFRDALGLDDAAWLRGRGWVLQPNISGMVYYEKTAPRMAESCRRTVELVLADFRTGGPREIRLS